MIQNIIINTIIPVVYAYGYINNLEQYKKKAFLWMEEADPEKNAVTSGFEALQMEIKSAFDSQALLQMKITYCNYKRCLQCAVGNAILKLNF